MAFYRCGSSGGSLDLTKVKEFASVTFHYGYDNPTLYPLVISGNNVITTYWNGSSNAQVKALSNCSAVVITYPEGTSSDIELKSFNANDVIYQFPNTSVARICYVFVME